MQHGLTHLSLFPPATNNPFFPFQWPPAPVADTSARLPPLADQATQVLQDSLPVAYSYSRQSKREAASACNKDPHISFFYSIFLLRFYQFPTTSDIEREPASADNCDPCSSPSQLSTSFKVTILFSLQYHCLSHQMLLPRSHLQWLITSEHRS